MPHSFKNEQLNKYIFFLDSLFKKIAPFINVLIDYLFLKIESLVYCPGWRLQTCDPIKHAPPAAFRIFS